MSQTLALSPSTLLAESDRSATLEHLPFVISPFGTVLTSLIIFAVLLGSYVVFAALGHTALIGYRGGVITFPADTRLAFALSVLITTILGVQRYARIKDCEDVPLLQHAMRGTNAHEFNMMNARPKTSRLVLATLVGFAVGLVMTYLSQARAPLGHFYEIGPTFYWFAAASGTVCALFCRGIEYTRIGQGESIRAINELKVDLLRVDELNVIGRSAARLAFIWFACTAAACLLFMGNGITAFTIALLVACAGMGIWVFVAMMQRVHHRIRAAKAEELHRLREQIDVARAQAHTHGEAAQKLQGLLAYETRIASAQEWPFDQPTLVRVGASALILTIPWFGQAVAGYIVENASRFVH